jgi:hypothetical protein
LFDNVEKRFFVLAAEQPGVMDRGGDDLIEGIDFIPCIDFGVGYYLWLLRPRRLRGKGEGDDRSQDGGTEQVTWIHESSFRN